jgi:hypothetical protein
MIFDGGVILTDVVALGAMKEVRSGVPEQKALNSRV